MAFLSGVLEGVKNENEVTTYDNYITTPSKNLKSVLDLLNSKIGTGRDGLVASVGEVKVWLERYWTEIWRSTSAVTNEISKFKDEKIGDEYMKRLSLKSDLKLQEQLADWDNVVQEIKKILQDIESGKASKLDNVLKQKINSELAVIKGSVNLLEDSAGKFAFKQQAKDVDETLLREKLNIEKKVEELCDTIKKGLEEQKTTVLAKINDESGFLKKKLAEDFFKLRKTVDQLKNTRIKEFENISYCLRVAKALVTKFEDGFKYPIIQKFDKIRNLLDKVNRSDMMAGADKEKSKLKQDAEKITEELKTVGSSMNGELTKLNEWKHEAAEVLKVLIKKCNEVVTALNKDAEGNKFRTELAYITLNAGQLDTAYTKTNEHLKNQVASVKGRDGSGTVDGALKMLNGLHETVSQKVNSDVTEFETPTWDLKTKIDELKNSIRSTIGDYVAQLAKLNVDSSGNVTMNGKTLDAAFGADSELKKWLSLAQQYEIRPALYMLKEQHGGKSFFTALKDVLAKKVDDANSQLGQLLQQTIRKGIMKLHNAIQIDNEIAKLRQFSDNVADVIDKEARQKCGNITGAIGRIQSELTAVSQMVKEDGTNNKDSVYQYLSDITSMLSLKETVQLTAKEFSSKTVKGLEMIYEKLKKLHGDELGAKVGKIQTAINIVIKRITELEEVPGEATALRDLTSNLMDELKNDVEHNITTIASAVIEADTLLERAIQSVESTIRLAQNASMDFVDALKNNATATINDAYYRSQQAVSHLQSQLLADVQTSFTNVTMQVRQMFAEGHKSDLKALRTLVSKQLKTIKSIIEKDLASGLKGFFKTMGEVSVETTTLTVPAVKLNALKDKDTVAALSTAFQSFFMTLKDYLRSEIVKLNGVVNKTNQMTPTEETVYTSKLGKVNVSFNDLLSHLRETNRYDHHVPGKLGKLSQAVAMLKPETFDRPNSPVLDGITRGLGAFVGELNKVYISAYDSQTFEKDLVHREDVVGTKITETKYELKEYGRNCSKVCLNVLSILHTEFDTLVKYCKSSSRSEQINKSNNIGIFFVDQGYDVSDSGEQNGELQNDKRMNVLFICKRLFGMDEKHIYRKDNFNQEIGPLKTLHDHLQTYYQVGHVATSSSKRRPCNIFEMLCWLSGLPCNTVYTELWRDAVSDLFIDPKKQPTEDDEIPVTVVSEELPAYPQAIELDNTQRAVKRLCSRSYDILIKIVGYGNEYTQYAVDYCDNTLRLYYPSDPSQCLDLLINILHRLLPVFRFLHSQCILPVQHGGWEECEYGKNIKATKWPCKEHLSDKATCLPNCQPNDQPKCQPTSPLMSYLNDCLPGHLPHQLSSIGCKYDCATCPSTSRKGQPCITPLGFRGFSGSTKTGKDLCSMLSKIIDNQHLASLFCLVTKPPKTLPEHFGFALSLVVDWHKGDIVGKKGVQNAFEESTKELSIRLCDKPGDLTGALVDAYGSDSVKHSTCSHPHLRHLASNDFCNKHPCAPYLSSLYADCYKYIANKNAKLYLYWAVYLPWDFWTLLNNLYTAFCAIACQDWGCNGCMRGDKCKKGKHGEEKSPCQCESIVTCNGVSPTLYQYGFIFNNAEELNRSGYQKRCNDFCTILSKVLKSDYFAKLFNACDDFLFTIRAPFIWLNVALWLLSLLYLIHIMVIRLDLLHIKSHLHSPSSHRIAAQSLLAAGRVNKLGRVFYLQP